MTIILSLSGCFASAIGLSPTAQIEEWLLEVYKVGKKCVMEDNEREELYSTPTTVFLQVSNQKRVQFLPLYPLLSSITHVCI